MLSRSRPAAERRRVHLGELENWAVSLGGPAARRHIPLFAAFFLFILFELERPPPVLRQDRGAPGADERRERHPRARPGRVLLLPVPGLPALGVRGYLGKFFVVHAASSKASAPGFIDLFVGLIEFMLEFIKPITLAMRLFGNIFGGEVALGVITALTIAIIPVAMLLPRGAAQLRAGADLHVAHAHVHGHRDREPPRGGARGARVRRRSRGQHGAAARGIGSAARTDPPINRSGPTTAPGGPRGRTGSDGGTTDGTHRRRPRGPRGHRPRHRHRHPDRPRRRRIGRNPEAARRSAPPSSSARRSPKASACSRSSSASSPSSSSSRPGRPRRWTCSRSSGRRLPRVVPLTAEGGDRRPPDQLVLDHRRGAQLRRLPASIWFAFEAGVERCSASAGSGSSRGSGTPSRRAATASSAEPERLAALTEARREANEILARAQKVAQETRDADIAATREELERHARARRRRHRGREGRAPWPTLRAEVADLALQAAGKVVGETMADARQRRLVEEFLASRTSGATAASSELMATRLMADRDTAARRYAEAAFELADARRRARRVARRARRCRGVARRTSASSASCATRRCRSRSASELVQNVLGRGRRKPVAQPGPAARPARQDRPARRASPPSTTGSLNASAGSSSPPPPAPRR